MIYMARIGLVLSGGMAKGAYQVGVLKAMEKYFLYEDISCISAASIGVLNAYAYASENLKYAMQIWEEAANTKSKYIASLINSRFLQKSIHILAQNLELAVPKFYLPLYCLEKNQLDYVDLIKTQQVIREDYLRAAVAMPIFCTAVQISHKNYYDGAIIDNIPIKPLYSEPLDYIICVYFDNCNYIFEDKYLDQRVIKVVFYNDQRIRPSLSMEKEAIEIMVREGYDKAARIFDFLFGSGKDDFELIFQKKEKLEQCFLSSKTRITGDVVVNNFNRIAKKMVRRNNILKS